jgi:hypothetical protein
MAQATATATPTDIEAGRLDKRLEAAITPGMDEAITALAKELAGAGNPRMFRSKAARALLAEGIRARAAKAARASRA